MKDIIEKEKLYDEESSEVHCDEELQAALGTQTLKIGLLSGAIEAHLVKIKKPELQPLQESQEN